MKNFTIKILILLSISMLAIVGCTPPRPTPNAEAKEAVTALKKVQAKVEVGTNSNDYHQAVGDANFAVKQFSESKGAKDFPTLEKAMLSAMQEYFYGAETWNAIIEVAGDSDQHKMTLDFANGKGLLDKIDDVEQQDFYDEMTIGKKSSVRINLDKLLQFRWQRAAAHVKEASKLLNEPS